MAGGNRMSVRWAALTRGSRRGKLRLGASAIAVGAIAVIVSGVVGLLDGDSATDAIVDIFGGSALLVADLVLVLVGAGVAGELDADRAQRASIAVAEERRRLARELYD